MFSGLSTSKNFAVARPGQYLDWYPETLDNQTDLYQQILTRLKLKKRGDITRFSSFNKIANRIDQEIINFSKASETQRSEILKKLQIDLRNTGFVKENLVRAFALVSVEVHQQFGFNLHREQLFCAWALLHGKLAEMATGEGKSITAALTAIVAALAGAPVHVITTNDYLVERDATSMRPLFMRFGLDCSYVSLDQEEDERRSAYAHAICYVSNKQLVFDYLRDRQQLGNRPSSIAARVQGLCSVQAPKPLLRGLCFAIVDEADSVLIDDAITPLILSQQMHGDQDVAKSLTAISLARRLKNGEDFTIDNRSRRVIVTEQGENQLAELTSGLEGVWKNRRFRHELTRQALSAIHLFQRDKDYIVRDGEVILVDQSTGRVMPDRKLQHGLHQMVETKEKCELTGQSETIASLSFQNFFKRYKHLCGMTGTAQEAATELNRVYGLSVVSVPTHQPSRRNKFTPQFTLDEESHREYLVTEIKKCNEIGQPVLVGTRTLAQSERISEFLSSANLKHQVLNARQDKDEAEIVSKAGAKGAITIATNIAGRGTDIPINEVVAQLGGLHVIVAELNDNQRIDRQLIGRSARQGDPGSYRYIISLTDEMLLRYVSSWWLNCIRNSFLSRSSIRSLICQSLSNFVQKIHEQRQRKMRKQVSLTDEEMNKRLSFSGYKE